MELGNIRITAFTDELIRVEFQKDEIFNDNKTQAVWYRDFSFAEFSVEEEAECITVVTKTCRYEISTLDGKLISVTLPDGHQVVDIRRGNLKGTKRTLDMTFGRIPLEDGILSKNGVAVLDDSKSLLVLEDGSIKEASTVLGRVAGGKDYYVFAYGREYKRALKDFYRLTGYPPLLPKFVLGNWWSRYHAYSQQEYLDLMDRFQEENIPLSVATIDMDWHWTDVVKRFGKDARNKQPLKGPSEVDQGWTGYSWNTDLFPDYKAFLKNLKDRGLAITLNVHPSMGVRFFEDAYEEFAKFLGKDPKTKEQLFFSLKDKYLEGYFKFLHHPYEEDGVDFWWIDWQQGKKSDIKGLDPLWALNHFHFKDLEERGKPAVILSRFAEAGSHRYPLGFSGDTAILWAALRFQPYFTATASNIGYSWWSHDIGGHFGMSPIKNQELYLRWLQFGVFSPILRLHSNVLNIKGKEPWNFRDDIHEQANNALRFRQRLMPYLQTMNYRTHEEGEPLLQPMYYDYPEEPAAYKVPNEYFFGSELLACPITRPTGLGGKAKVKTWLPKGKWTDIFTNRIYIGGGFETMERDLSSIPVFAKEGAIVPLEGKTTDDLEVLVFTGTNKFVMKDEDIETTFELTKEPSRLTLHVDNLKKPTTFSFRNITKGTVTNAGVLVIGGDQRYDFDEGYLRVYADPCDLLGINIYLFKL